MTDDRDGHEWSGLFMILIGWVLVLSGLALKNRNLRSNDQTWFIINGIGIVVLVIGFTYEYAVDRSGIKSHRVQSGNKREGRTHPDYRPSRSIGSNTRVIDVYEQGFKGDTRLMERRKK